MRFLAFALSWVVAGSVLAEGSGRAFGILPVRVEVQPTASLKSEIKSNQLLITAADIDRGYIDLPPSFLSVNVGGALPAIQVEFTPVADLFRSMEIRTSDAVAASGGERSKTAGEALVSYRLVLDGHASPGLYPLPLTVSVIL